MIWKQDLSCAAETCLSTRLSGLSPTLHLLQTETCSRKNWHVSGNVMFRIWSIPSLPSSLRPREHQCGKLVGPVDILPSVNQIFFIFHKQDLKFLVSCVFSKTVLLPIYTYEEFRVVEWCKQKLQNY